LEAMEERQVTIQGETHALPEPFFVIATQNPVEYEGTYPLPEAQLDRFLFKLTLDYPDEAQELEVYRTHGLGSGGAAAADGGAMAPVCAPADVLQHRAKLSSVTVEDGILEYIAKIVRQ